MKRLNILGIFVLVIFSVSCSKLLNTDPQTSISDEEAIVDGKSAQAALTGVYDGLQRYASSQIIALDLAGDNVVNYNNQNIVVATKTAASTGGGFSSIYTMINRANFVITKVPTLADALFATGQKNQILGQAYFLRALGYFDLVKTYGGVQVVLDPLKYTGIKRSTKDQTYDQVLSDLDKAEQLLTETVNRNIANRFSVYALKARLYLYREQWDKAAEYATKVISNNNFVLVKPFSSFFTGKNTTESVFELAFSTANKNTFFTNWLSAAEGGRRDYVPARDFTALLLDATKAGSRRSLIKQLPDASWEVVEYGKQDGTSSIFILRIAEQYLIRAEARVKQATPDLKGAVADLNEIRGRADLISFELTTTTKPAEVLQAIESERRYELAFEGHRFVDIVRTGRAAEVFGPYNKQLTDSKFWIFPIPASAVLNDPANLGGENQNPGY
ncbi:RagB/SusD family nutrient uptake outer membrane protein [Chitinophaga silvatica]|uniref:RagB/SusD family nutrient uptake outer membrane protein n=1 Tax=Chitinophaga silvatica TaxID=2282649 RepID=A0A3E1YDA3_9BACT|nr:RagB/SusD family nutrient uptake outer membrane protein [Chitinophaga silvatica]RFS24501.1 RagB/SusD family nutrient uptake outer membrane protein [Chitinophaga silvatica]